MGPNPLCIQTPGFLQGATPVRGGQGQTWQRHHHLVRAPAPGGQHRQPKNEAWPRNVPAHSIPEHVEGVGPG